MSALKALALDVRSLAAFRIGLAGMILLDLVVRARDLRAHYTDGGVFPRALAFDVLPRAFWSFHFATGSALGQGALFVVAGILALLLLLGFRTRVTSLLSLVLLVSLQNRTPSIFYGFDQLLRACLLWACFLPLDARFVHPRFRASSSTRSLPDEHLSAGVVAYAAQMVIVYLFSGIQKLEQPGWRALTALREALLVDNHGTWLARALANSGLDGALSVAVLAVELFGPLLLLVPLWLASTRERARLAAFVLFAGFHVATALVFTIGLFPWMGVIAWLPFLPGRVWSRAPSSEPRPGLVVDRSWPSSLVVAVTLAFVVAFNVETVVDVRVIPDELRLVGRALRLEQTWNMYARPMRDGWYVARARRVDGSEIDPLRRDPQSPVSFEKPESVSSSFPDMRWRKYLTTLSRRPGERERIPFARWLCRLANQYADTPAHRVTSLDLIFVSEDEPIGAPPDVRRHILASVRCGGRNMQTE